MEPPKGTYPPIDVMAHSVTPDYCKAIFVAHCRCGARLEIAGEAHCDTADGRKVVEEISYDLMRQSDDWRFVHASNMWRGQISAGHVFALTQVSNIQPHAFLAGCTEEHLFEEVSDFIRRCGLTPEGAAEKTVREGLQDRDYGPSPIAKGLDSFRQVDAMIDAANAGRRPIGEGEDDYATYDDDESDS